MQLLWCKPRWEGMWCSASMLDFCSAPYFGRANPVSASAIFAPFNLQLKPESVYINGWIQNCTLTAPTLSMCSALNHPSGSPIWKILSGLCRRGTCNAGVGKTTPLSYWGLELQWLFSESSCPASFPPWCERRSSLMLHYHLLENQQADVMRNAFSLSHTHTLTPSLAVTEIDFSVCHWWHCTIAVFKLAAAW